MEVKAWSYEEIPEFTDEVEGAVWLDTTGDEPQVDYLPDVAYATYGDRTLRLQILKPRTRNNPTPRSLPCFVYVQGSAWRKQNIYHDIPQLARMAALGYVAALVEYRGSDEATFPCPIVDARNAVRFLRSHASNMASTPVASCSPAIPQAATRRSTPPSGRARRKTSIPASPPRSAA